MVYVSKIEHANRNSSPETKLDSQHSWQKQENRVNERERLEQTQKKQHLRAHDARRAPRPTTQNPEAIVQQRTYERRERELAHQISAFESTRERCARDQAHALAQPHEKKKHTREAKLIKTKNKTNQTKPDQNTNSTHTLRLSTLRKATRAVRGVRFVRFSQSQKYEEK